MAQFQLALGVTPEDLKTQAGKLTSSVEKICADYQKLADLMDGTAAYWLGDAGTRYRKNYDDQKGAISQLEERMKTYPERILQMAGLYEQAESSNEQISTSLGNDLHLV